MNIICKGDEVCFLSDNGLVDEDFSFTGYDATSQIKLIWTFPDNTVCVFIFKCTSWWRLMYQVCCTAATACEIRRFSCRILEQPADTSELSCIGHCHWLNGNNTGSFPHIYIGFSGRSDVSGQK